MHIIGKGKSQFYFSRNRDIVKSGNGITKHVETNENSASAADTTTSDDDIHAAGAVDDVPYFA